MPQVEVLRYDQSFRRAPPRFAPILAKSRWSRFYALGESLGEPGRAAIFWIAVLVAFLTVAALWKVPDTVIEPGTAAAAGTAATEAASTDNDVFKSNLGRTVLSGLTGIAAVTLLKDVWGVSGPAGQQFFAVTFIIAFLALLVVSALLRAFIEGVRDRVATTRPRIHSLTSEEGPVLTFRLWLASYHTTLLVFWDTFTSVLFGHAPKQVLAWSKRFAELQETLVATADRVREQVSDAVGYALRDKQVPDARAERDYRVNVSLLAADSTHTFYISAARGSLSKDFGPRSVAYVVARSGQARWWKKSFYAPDTVLFHNDPSVFADSGTELLLKEYVEDRGGLDYNAFVVIPIPLLQRGLTQGQRRAAIHISFKDIASLDLLWTKLDTTDGTSKHPAYDLHPQILEPSMLGDRVLAAVLSAAVRVLAEVIQPLNDKWYRGRR